MRLYTAREGPMPRTELHPLRLMAWLALLLATVPRCRAKPEDSLLQLRMAGLSGHASPRPFGGEKVSRAEEFNYTGVLQPEYQFRATLKPNEVSQFHYLCANTGPPLTLLVSPCSGPISWSVSYVGPPETDEHAEGQTGNWPLKQMIARRTLFKYEGADTQNFTMPAEANLYRIEMQPVNTPSLDLKIRSPNTVLLYATSENLGRQPSNLLEFQQRWNRRKLIVSWNKSKADPNQSSYLLAVTSGAHLHPPTLCAAENILKKHPCPSRLVPLGAQLAQERGEPEGLHCVRRTKLTLYGVKHDTTYHFTLYIMNTHTNVSSRVAMDSFRFQRKPPIDLPNGCYVTTDLRERLGSAIYRYRPRLYNISTIFSIFVSNGGTVKAKFRGPGGYSRQETIEGEFVLKAPPLPPGKRFNVQLTATQADLVKFSKVKVLATDDSVPFTDYMLQKSGKRRATPWEYRKSRNCRRMKSARRFNGGPRAPGGGGSTPGSCAPTTRRGPAHSRAGPACPSLP